ncbi:MAG: glutamate mutase L [Ardenticatenaceae bacterium]|nr:glutamate mutase L [Ardenticatenaceae bacterium]MCB9445525.1 glutamate mutase L [Ardenticatenaceae bacterium]
MTEYAEETKPATPNTPPKSFLVADCGTTNTTVALFDEAAGSYRLIASTSVPTTAAEPWYDVYLGMRQATEKLEAATGRTLLNSRGDLIRPARASGSGVDAFASVFSAAPALKTITAGLFDKVSLASARRVVGSSYAVEVDALSLSDTRSQNEQIASIIHHQPDLILVVGGTDKGATQQPINLLETIRIGSLALSEAKAPQVLFAGNTDLREQAGLILGENIQLHIADNVHPSLNSENLHDAVRQMDELYGTIKIKALPGIQNVRDWTSIPFRPTAQSLTIVTEFLAELQKGRVVLVDLGSSSTTVVDAGLGGNGRIHVRNDLGMGRPISNLPSVTPLADITRWLATSEEDESYLLDFIHNKALYPYTVPTTENEMFMEQAAAREILRQAAEPIALHHNDPAAPLRLVIARGSIFMDLHRYNQALLTLLDALQPAGIFAVAVDAYGILPALGVLAANEPLAAVQTLEGNVLVSLGWVVAPFGKGQSGQKILQVVMETDETQLEVEVEYGTIETLPLAAGQSAKVTLQPARRVDIGYGPGQGHTVTIRGGAVGLVIDARGRPLTMPVKDNERQTLLRQWLWDIGG